MVLTFFFNLIFIQISSAYEKLVCTMPKSLGCASVSEAHKGIPSTAEAWIEMLKDATTNIDIDMSYFASPKNGKSKKTKVILDIIKTKAESGVKIRMFVDGNVVRKNGYNDLDSFPKHPNISILSTGISNIFSMNHKKMIVIDQGSQAYVGSANLDANLIEGNVGDCGIIFDGPAAKNVYKMFERYYSLFNSDKSSIFESKKNTIKTQEEVSPKLVCSHFGEIDSESSDKSTSKEIINIIKNTKYNLTIQMFVIFSSETFEVVKNDKSKNFVKEIYKAIDDACARGVNVDIISDGSHFKENGVFAQEVKKIEFISDIKINLPSCINQNHKGNLLFKLINVPKTRKSYGYDPQIHSKYMISDLKTAWIGSENWKDPYFNGGSNCGVVTTSKEVVEKLSKIFSSYKKCDKTKTINFTKSNENISEDLESVNKKCESNLDLNRKIFDRFYKNVLKIITFYL